MSPREDSPIEDDHSPRIRLRSSIIEVEVTEAVLGTLPENLAVEAAAGAPVALTTTGTTTITTAKAVGRVATPTIITAEVEARGRFAVAAGPQVGKIMITIPLAV